MISTYIVSHKSIASKLKAPQCRLKCYNMAAVTSPKHDEDSKMKRTQLHIARTLYTKFQPDRPSSLGPRLYTDTQTDRQTDRQTHTHTYRHPRSFSLYRYDNNIFSLLKVTEYKKAVSHRVMNSQGRYYTTRRQCLRAPSNSP